jgi:hypothetical protein
MLFARARSRSSLPAVAVAATALAAAVPAAAFDLTGHWEGKYACKTFNAGFKDGFSSRTSEIEITQVGTSVILRVDGVDTYRGLGIDGAAKPEAGALYAVRCTTDDVPGAQAGGFDELGHFTVKTGANGKGSLRGFSIFNDDDPEVGTCKWSYKRVDTLDPGLADCP